MKSNVTGRNYVILQAGDNIPLKLNKKRTDLALKRLIGAYETINREIKELEKNDSGILSFLYDMTLKNSYWSDDEDAFSWRIEHISEDLKELQAALREQNDEIVPEEEAASLSDLGYRCSYVCGGVWEKQLDAEEPFEIVEEIQTGEEPLRRIRTIEWEETEYGRTSKSIRYRKLPIGKKLMKAIDNSRR